MHGEEKPGKIVTVQASKIYSMAKPKSVRPKFGSAEWSAQVGVTPVKKQGFGTSASRNMALVKPVVEAQTGGNTRARDCVCVCLSTFVCVCVCAEAPASGGTVWRHASRSPTPQKYNGTPARYMQPARPASVERSGAVHASPTTNRRHTATGRKRTPSVEKSKLNFRSTPYAPLTLMPVQLSEDGTPIKVAAGTFMLSND